MPEAIGKLQPAKSVCQQFGQPMLTGDCHECSGIPGSEQAEADHQVP